MAYRSLIVEAGVPTRLAVLALAFAALPASSAGAAEVVANAPDEIRVSQGGLTPFEVAVSAEGVIGCGATPAEPSTAAFDSVHSLVDGQAPVGAQPGSPLRFYANSQLVLLPPLGCGVTWDGAPEPYRFNGSLAAASNVPVGTYTLELRANVANPDGAFFAPLGDGEPERVAVVVEPAVQGPLPDPLENRSINLLPVRGSVRVRYPGSAVSVQLTDPVQVPPDTGVNAENGFVTLQSDAVGTGVTQSATLWDGGFKVDYTRVLDLERPRGRRRTAGAPITEFTVSGGPGPCGPGQARASAAAAKGKRLWARGKGRFRTRGRYGAGTVRGTHWRFSETCGGTLLDVRSGVVTMADFTIRSKFAVGPGQSYLAQPPDPRRGASRSSR